MFAPDRVTKLLPTLAPTVPLVQSVVGFGFAATVRPVGKVSVKLTPVN